MKVSNWNWDKADKMVAAGSLDRARKAAHVVAARARQNCPVGTKSRPIASKGVYAGQAWTARDAGQLRRSIRVVERQEDKRGFAFTAYGITDGLVRVYAGHYLAYYARIVEFYRPYLRPALEASQGDIKQIMENG